ncbi:ABC transporter substrate-binding protein [Roseinatronobacter alkalisoli]|uniref:ABC transporter substrate-binding protein n=1 Tax=Roseinatronobacter alkalisoli TaxID=3028235 RepID=A0ABT5TAV2_9RHOB|nr:ABC transporter substrate-binding protein [Roseinatronobacter sp. HJB301]MDD7972255.1 ABC transporter substrate-binding protein [Roseinatronobacter sp. HJB301]
MPNTSSRAFLMSASAALALTAGAVSADTLRIGLASEPTSVDPHYHNLGPNNALARHIFTPLIEQDAQQLLNPGLATEWEAVDDTTWRLTLREGVTFSNGAPFTARDVIYTICRIPLVPDAPSPFTLYTRAIAGLEAEDDHTLIVTTDGPAPLLPNQLATFGIISASVSGAEDEVSFDTDGCTGIGDAPASAEFNDPAFAIGTGPYTLDAYIRGEELRLTRNDNYYGDAPAWEQIVMRPLTNAGARVAALLAGDVQMIENPPTQDIARIEGDGFVISSGLSNRVIYIALDQGDAPTPGIAGDTNPLQDARVREALALAIDREAIQQRLMLGLSEPAGELLPAPMFGTNPDRPAIPYDAERARELLADAGYPDGFQIVLGTPNDRYINDGAISQAVAQMWTQVGVQTEVDAKTFSAFIADRNGFNFSAFLAGWGAGTGEMSSPLGALVATRDPDRSLGGTNFARHSNPDIDDRLVEALQTVDDAERERLLREASAIAMDTFAIVPIHYELTTWALAPGLEYEARADQYTLGFAVTQAD